MIFYTGYTSPQSRPTNQHHKNTEVFVETPMHVRKWIGSGEDVPTEEELNLLMQTEEETC